MGRLEAGAHILAIGLLLTVGCARTPKPIFESHQPPIIWPPAPAAPRIRYVGQLRSSADLKAQPKPFQALGDFLFGARDAQVLYGPRSVLRTVDGRRVWIADPGGRCLHLFDMEGRQYKKIDRLGDARLMSPVDLCAGPEGSIYVCDSEAAAIYRIDGSTGAWLETLRFAEELRRPVAIAYDADAAELFVVDVTAHNVKVLGRDGRLHRIIGQRGNALGELNFPCDVAFKNGETWVVDSGNHRVQGFGPDGVAFVAFGQAGDSPGDLALPKGVALDSRGFVYVVDARFENVQVFSRSGRLLLVFGQEGTEPGEFWLPGGIFIDGEDRIWICDSYNRRVQVFDRIEERKVDGESAGVSHSED